MQTIRSLDSVTYAVGEADGLQKSPDISKLVRSYCREVRDDSPEVNPSLPLVFFGWKDARLPKLRQQHQRHQHSGNPVSRCTPLLLWECSDAPPPPPRWGSLSTHAVLCSWKSPIPWLYWRPTSFHSSLCKPSV